MSSQRNLQSEEKYVLIRRSLPSPTTAYIMFNDGRKPGNRENLIRMSAVNRPTVSRRLIDGRPADRPTGPTKD